MHYERTFLRPGHTVKSNNSPSTPNKSTYKLALRINLIHQTKATCPVANIIHEVRERPHESSAVHSAFHRVLDTGGSISGMCPAAALWGVGRDSCSVQHCTRGLAGIVLCCRRGRGHVPSRAALSYHLEEEGRAVSYRRLEYAVFCHHQVHRLHVSCLRLVSSVSYPPLSYPHPAGHDR